MERFPYCKLRIAKHLLSLQSYPYLGFSIKPIETEQEGAEVWEGMSVLPSTSPSAQIRLFSE